MVKIDNMRRTEITDGRCVLLKLTVMKYQSREERVSLISSLHEGRTRGKRKSVTWMNGVVFLLFVADARGQTHSYYEGKLRKYLFEELRINPSVRPVQNRTEALKILLYFWIHHIIHLDERSETLSLSAWQCMEWHDFNLKWDPTKFGDIYLIRVDTSKIWFPDIVLLNNAEAVDIQPQTPTPAWVFSDGDVRICFTTDYKSFCPLDLRKFPFDEHECPFIFRPWTYWRSKVNVTISEYFNKDLTSYMLDEHNQWEITKSFGNQSLYSYRCCPQYEIVFPTFYVRIRRRAPFYHLAFLLPSLIAMMMTLLIFWMPPTKKERFTFGGINCLILIFFLIHLFWIIPRSGSNVPALVVLIGNALFFSGFSLVISMATTTLCRKPPQLSPPQIIRSFLSIALVRFLFCLPSASQITSKGKQNDIVEGSDQTTKPTSDEENEWTIIATAVDRISFYVYCLAFVIILVVAFN